MKRKFTASVFPVFNWKVLLINHKKIGMWLPPGGKLENIDDGSETPIKAARRELMEETGLTGVFPPMKGEPDGTPLGFIGYEEHDIQIGSYWEKHMNFCFMCHVSSNMVVSDGSFTDHLWVTAEDAKSMKVPRNVIDLILKIESVL